MKRLWLAILLLALPALARAEVRPNPLCTEGMVLQRDRSVDLWGEADPGETVTVTFRGTTAFARAGADKKWVIAIPTKDAGGPFDLTITGDKTDKKIAYKNVLVGEVWVCSGQSNMEWTLNQCQGNDLKAAKEAPANPNLRMFTVQRVTPTSPQTTANGKWIEAAPDTVGPMSAVGYYFGKDLNKALKIPVGLIHTSWGGTRAEAWTSKKTLDASPIYKDESANFAKAVEEKTAKVGSNSPSVLYNGMIAPILNYGIKGAIWYQGESNAGKAFHYRTLFPMMIENWRKDFAQGDFPFYFVQLASFQKVAETPGESNWAELREAQTMTLKLKNTGMAVITDLGNVQDIHPTPKKDVGERLALWARAKDYGEKIVYSGPLYAGMKVDGDKVVLSFDHTGGGLVAKKLVPVAFGKNTGYRVDENAKDAELTGFAIAGKDKKFVNAKAVIKGDNVIVSSPDVTEPIAVRYAWANYPIAGLFNREGLPASPFRTDDFPITTQPKQQ